jgi:GntR family transcriptional regulator, transcriptional repressor for pyruvate dehydrogenase complex
MSKPALNRVRKAYEQAADQLRDQILSGSIKAGERLPKELELAELLGVSRTTVREALRTLASEGLIRTTKGAAGGSFVMTPSVDHISEFLTSNINLLAAMDDLALDELMEVRRCLEIPAARMAAERMTQAERDSLDESVAEDEAGLSTEQEFALNKGFHSILVEATGNKLLVIAAQPIFVVLQTYLQRTLLDAADHSVIHRGHAKVAEAIAAGDGDAAEAEMSRHLSDLYPLYERAWTGRTDAGRV